MAAENISSAVGPAGIGALCVLGILLILDGRSPAVLGTVERYGNTTTWGIVAAVPLLAITYLLGILVVTAAESLMHTTFGPSFVTETSDLLRIGNFPLDKSALAQGYVQLRQESRLLAGSSIALIFLALGAFSEIPNVQEVKGPTIALGFATLLIAFLTFGFGCVKANDAHMLAVQAATHHTNSVELR
jgi:hypothetical protein